MLQNSSGRNAFGLRVLFAVLLLLSLGACGTGDDDDSSADVPVVGSDVETPGDDLTTSPEDVSDPDVCVPKCAGKQCGDDGCGGICGHCLTMEGAVKDDLCLADNTCTPCGCGEQECGIDLCGSPCGTCPGSWVCNDQFKCEPPPVNCDFTGFHGVDDYAKANKDSVGGFTFHYQGISQETMPFDVLVVDMDTGAGGPTGPGLYDLAYQSFDQGGLYVYILKGWNGNGYDDLYVPTEGTLEIKSLSKDGGQFQATLHKGILEQAKFNGDTNAPDFVAHGKIWCLDNVSIDTELLVTQEYCVEGGTGPSIGDNIANFKLQRCDGQWVDLHDSCEAYKAIWIVGTAGW